MHRFPFLMSWLAPLQPQRWRWPTVRNLRWASGWVLWLYVLLHLLNHAMGLVSLHTAEVVREGLHQWWHSTLGTSLLYSALLVHASLALLAVAQRRTWRLSLIHI